MLTSAAVSKDQILIPVGPLADAVRAAATGNTGSSQLRDVLRLAVSGGRFTEASITIIESGDAFRSVASTGDLAAAGDHMQYDLAEGPSLTAARNPGVVSLADVLSDLQWPSWAAVAADAGINSALAVHLFADGDLGSLTLYSRQAGPVTDNEVQAAVIVGAHVSALLAFSRTTDNLRRAIDARNLIGQAQGVLMERYRLTSDAAFALLSRYSQRHNIKVSALAAELTSTGTLPDLETSLTAAH